MGLFGSFFISKQPSGAAPFAGKLSEGAILHLLTACSYCRLYYIMQKSKKGTMKILTVLLSPLSELCNRFDIFRKHLISKLYSNRNRSVIAYSESTRYNIDSKGKEINKQPSLFLVLCVRTTSRRKDHSHDGVAHHRPLNTPFGKRIKPPAQQRRRFSFFVRLTGIPYDPDG